MWHMSNNGGKSVKILDEKWLWKKKLDKDAITAQPDVSYI